jgi:hypothetical protein
MEDSSGYIFKWLIAYSALLGAVGGNERERLTHPERVKLTHLGLQNGRSGQER